MPQGGGSGQPWEAGAQAGQGSGPPPGAPGQPGYGEPGYGQPQYGQQQYGQPPQYGGGQPGPSGPEPSGQPGGGAMPDRSWSPVNEGETRVSGRRVVQFIIDGILSGVIFWLVSWALDRGTGATQAVLTLIQAIVDIAWYFAYWALIPYVRNGQTFGMTLLDVRVISKDGGPASLLQMFVRSLLIWLPLGPVVGFVVMLCSRYRQRTGDHMARTLVVRAAMVPGPARREFADAGQSGNR
jgi:uncharacterized RDD family membrane protein YckC